MTATASRGPTRPTPTPARRLQAVPALDGLRGLAVAAVVAFHYPLGSWCRGGLFGVGVFFVLSGFLVTAGLLDEGDRDATVRVAGFLRRRAWRLLPALLVLLVVFLVLAAAYRHQPWFGSNPFGSRDGRPVPMTTALAAAGIAVSYWYNVVLARSWATPSPLGHLWTLSLEMQFYVLVAVAVWLAARWRRTGIVLPVALGAIAASAAAPFLLWHGGRGQNEIYFGSATNAQQLLGGVALAVVWRNRWVDRVPAVVRRTLGAVGGATLLWMLFEVGNVPFKYLGALTVVTAATAAVMVHLLVPSRTDRGASRWLSHPALTWLGRRSYGIYLWHWPLAEWTNRLPRWYGVPVGIAVTLALAEASWRVVEQPASRFSRRGRRSAPPARGGPARRAGIAATGAADG